MPTLSSQVESFDPANYTRAPIITLESGISLARALSDGCPAGMPTPIKKAAARLGQVATAAESAAAARQREQNTPSEDDSRTLDLSTDGAWGGLRLRLLGYASLPDSVTPKAARARGMVQTLFGKEGLTFLSSAYPVQLTTMGAILLRIQDDKLGKEIDELCGPEFLPCLRDLQQRYQQMVSGQLQRSSTSSDDLREHVRALSRAIVLYATKACATAEEDDTTTIERILTALRPLDAYREATSRRAAGSDTEPDAPPTPAPAPPQ